MAEFSNFPIAFRFAIARARNQMLVHVHYMWFHSLCFTHYMLTRVPCSEICFSRCHRRKTHTLTKIIKCYEIRCKKDANDIMQMESILSDSRQFCVCLSITGPHFAWSLVAAVNRMTQNGNKENCTRKCLHTKTLNPLADISALDGLHVYDFGDQWTASLKLLAYRRAIQIFIIFILSE